MNEWWLVQVHFFPALGHPYMGALHGQKYMALGIAVSAEFKWHFVAPGHSARMNPAWLADS
jgi:hypothetical protein